MSEHVVGVTAVGDRITSRGSVSVVAVHVTLEGSAGGPVRRFDNTSKIRGVTDAETWKEKGGGIRPVKRLV